MEGFRSRHDAVLALIKALGAEPSVELVDVLSPLVQEVRARSEKRPTSVNAEDLGFHVPGTDAGYVVQDDHLNLLEVAAKAVLVGAGANHVGGPPAAAVAASVVAVGTLLVALHRKHYKCSREEWLVLSFLSRDRERGFTALELVEAFEAFGGPMSLSQEQATVLLQSLEDAVLADGTKSPLVSRDTAGYWRPSGW